MRVLITGVTGFIGSHLAKKLVDEGYRVYGVARHCASRDLQPIKGVLDKITLITADIADYMSIHHALKAANPDVVCSLAALTPVRYSFEHPFQYEKYNYMGTMNVAHALMELPDYKKRRLIAASTAEVYGMQDVEEPFTEDLPLKPSSPYAVSKAAADMYLRMGSLVYGLNCVILRPSNTYGRKYEMGFMVEYLVTTMLKDERVYIGAPDSVRDYIYVDDHVGAYMLAIEKDLGSGETYNVGSGVGITNKELAEKVAKIAGYNMEKVVLGSYPPGYPLRPIASDQPYLVLNPSKIRKHGWAPKVSLDEGLRKVLDYWKQRI